MILESNQGLSQTRLARLMNAEPMAMVRILDRMERDGLLERRADPDDRRARRLFLTRSARPLLREIWRLAELTRGELFRSVTQRDRKLFVRVLEKLHQDVIAMQPGEDEPLPGPMPLRTPRRTRAARPGVSPAAAHMNPRYRMPLMLLGLLAAAGIGLYWYLSGGRFQDTDDAYVQMARVPISTNVAGRVSEIAVRENQSVHRGDLLFRLDPAPVPDCGRGRQRAPGQLPACRWRH